LCHSLPARVRRGDGLTEVHLCDKPAGQTEWMAWRRRSGNNNDPTHDVEPVVTELKEHGAKGRGVNRHEDHRQRTIVNAETARNQSGLRCRARTDRV